jgi:hypothetical protein
LGKFCTNIYLGVFVCSVGSRSAGVSDAVRPQDTRILGLDPHTWGTLWVSGRVPVTVRHRQKHTVHITMRDYRRDKLTTRSALRSHSPGDGRGASICGQGECPGRHATQSLYYFGNLFTMWRCGCHTSRRSQCTPGVRIYCPLVPFSPPFLLLGS